jgi:hypothetical protein
MQLSGRERTRSSLACEILGVDGHHLRPAGPRPQRTNSMPSVDPNSLRSFAPAIPMMQAAQPRIGNYRRSRRRPAFDWPSTGRILF